MEHGGHAIFYKLGPFIKSVSFFKTGIEKLIKTP